MFEKAGSKNRAVVNAKDLKVMIFCDDGWEEILSCWWPVESVEAGEADLIAMGYAKAA